MGKLSETISALRSECLRVYGEEGFFTVTVEQKHLTLKPGVAPRSSADVRVFASSSVGMAQKFSAVSATEAAGMALSFLIGKSDFDHLAAHQTTAEIEELGGES